MKPVNTSSKILFLVVWWASGALCGDFKSDQRLLLILLDGFRFDYLNQTGLPLPGFDQIANKGVRAGGFVPDFPSSSYPNYYSIMTGLHTESHGMTANYMYDVVRNESFLIGTNPEQNHSHWWESGDPLWITAARQKKTSYLYYWPGCEVEIRHLRPTFCEPYSSVPTFEQFRHALNQSLALLQSGQADIAGIYFEQTDSVGHKYGPFSAELTKVILELDPIMSDLVERLSHPDLSNVNLLIFADHGMTEVSSRRVIEIWKQLNQSDYVIILESGAMASIYTLPEKEEQVYRKLATFHPNMTVYRKNDLPERWHYKRGRYVAPLTAVADLGWLIITPYTSQKAVTIAGAHGYDPTNSHMQGIFLALGPAFKAGQMTERIHVVDVYQIMCDILNIQASPNNGSLSHFSNLLTSSASSLTLYLSLIFLSSLLVLVCQ